MQQKINLENIGQLFQDAPLPLAPSLSSNVAFRDAVRRSLMRKEVCGMKQITVPY